MPVTVPLGRFQGDRPTITGDRQVPSQPGSKAAEPPIQVDRWCRNGQHPDAAFFNQINAAANAGMLFRTKEVLQLGQVLGGNNAIDVSPVSGTFERFRGAFHTSPYHHALYCSAVMYPQSTGYDKDAYAKLLIYSDPTEATLVTEAEFHYGANPLKSSDAGWQYLKEVTAWITGLDPDTTYYAKVNHYAYGLMQSISAADIQSATQTNDGYLPINFGTQSQLLDEYRANVLEVIPPLWKRSGAKLFNWTVGAQGVPRQITGPGSTWTNIINNTSTTRTASDPFFRLNLTGKARISQTGVPFRLVARCVNDSANKGEVRLADASGNSIATCAFVGSAATWITGTGELPATDAAYYLEYRQTSGAANNFYVYAVSAYEYE